MKRKKRIGTTAKAVGCAVLLMISLFPIYWLLAMAIRPTDEMRGHIALIPQSLTGMHFAQLFTSENFGQAIMNSLQTTFGSLIISLLAGICAAYVIARRRFRFGLKKPMTYWVLLVRVLPPVAFTIPLYIMFNRLGVLNTKLPVMLACVLINVPLIIWFLISFFQDLPEEIEESAKVDGATEWQLFCKIVLPLVAPGIAAVSMLSFMYAWNEYTYTVIFTPITLYYCTYTAYTNPMSRPSGHWNFIYKFHLILTGIPDLDEKCIFLLICHNIYGCRQSLCLHLHTGM